MLVLPAITTSLIPMGIVTRTVRALTGDILLDDFFAALRAQGLREPTCFATSSRTRRRPRSRVMGLQIGYLLGGSILIETVFPGRLRGCCSIPRSSRAILPLPGRHDPCIGAVLRRSQSACLRASCDRSAIKRS